MSAKGKQAYVSNDAPDRRPDERQSLLRRQTAESDNDSIYSAYAASHSSNTAQRSPRVLKAIRYGSFASAIFNCLCAGSITAYSLYGHLFITRLLYSQLEVNAISIAASIGTYLAAPFWGYMCDRLNPRIPSLVSGVLFGISYLLAAYVYKQGPPPKAGGDGWSSWVMIVAFLMVGAGTSCMYLSALSTCAKNFGRGRFKGLAMACPVAAFGLSGMWQSQVGSRLLYEINADGTKGDVNVFKYFIFLAITLFLAGLIGFFTLQVINEAVDELARGGLLEVDTAQARSYGTVDTVHDERPKLHSTTISMSDTGTEKKKVLLNLETRRFLADPTMWLLAAGFFCATGPGESFINNFGTVIPTLYTTDNQPPKGIAASQVSINAVSSTVARLLAGTLTDILAPKSTEHQSLIMSDSIPFLRPSKSCAVSRIIFLLTFGILMMIGCILLVSGAVQSNPSLFSFVTALFGVGYGAIFSLTPIICSVVWGLENFTTNWGIVTMTPAPGVTLWGIIYSSVYQHASERLHRTDGLCYGVDCYRATFAGMAGSVFMACVFWTWAWLGPGGWKRRGIAV